MSTLEDTCDFSQDYAPIEAEDTVDEPLLHHLRNCQVCQDEIQVVDAI